MLEPVIVGSSGGTAVITGMLLSWNSLHGLRNTSKNVLCEHCSPCHPQMRFKALSCKEEAIREHDPKLQKLTKVISGPSSSKTEVKENCYGCYF